MNQDIFIFSDGQIEEINRIAGRTHRPGAFVPEGPITQKMIEAELSEVIREGRCAGDCEFKARARFYQAVFSRLILGLDLETKETNPRSRFGNILGRGCAESFGNYFHGFLDVMKKEKELRRYNPNLRANTLRSEHIPLNVFVPMGVDTESREFAKKVFNDLLGEDRIFEVSAIIIEKKPAPKEDFLNDNTGFDAYVEYLNHSGRRCGIGIEVKYTEGSYSIGTKESREVIDPESRYMKVTALSGNYIEGKVASLAGDEVRQLWRNHLLGAAMMLSDGPEHLDEFTSVHLYPERNTHFWNMTDDGRLTGAVPDYLGTLSRKGWRSFFPVTFENFFDLLSRHYPREKYGEWIDYLKDRYIPSGILSGSGE